VLASQGADHFRREEKIRIPPLTVTSITHAGPTKRRTGNSVARVVGEIMAGLPVNLGVERRASVIRRTAASLFWSQYQPGLSCIREDVESSRLATREDRRETDEGRVRPSGAERSTIVSVPRFQASTTLASNSDGHRYGCLGARSASTCRICRRRARGAGSEASS